MNSTAYESAAYEVEREIRFNDPDRNYVIETVWNDGIRYRSWPYTEYEAYEMMDYLYPVVGSYVPDRGATLLSAQMLHNGVVVNEIEY